MPRLGSGVRFASPAPISRGISNGYDGLSIGGPFVSRGSSFTAHRDLDSPSQSSAFCQCPRTGCFTTAQILATCAGPSWLCRCRAKPFETKQRGINYGPLVLRGAAAPSDSLFAKLCGSMHQNHFRVWNSAQRKLHCAAGPLAKRLDIQDKSDLAAPDGPRVAFRTHSAPQSRLGRVSQVAAPVPAWLARCNDACTQTGNGSLGSLAVNAPNMEKRS